jgi:hypothetical protein
MKMASERADALSMPDAAGNPATSIWFAANGFQGPRVN